MFSSDPYSSMPSTSTSQMYLTHNGRVESIITSVQMVVAVTLTIDQPNTVITLEG